MSLLDVSVKRFSPFTVPLYCAPLVAIGAGEPFRKQQRVGGGEENYKCVSTGHDKDYLSIICKAYLYSWKHADFNPSRYPFCGTIPWQQKQFWKFFQEFQKEEEEEMFLDQIENLNSDHCRGKQNLHFYRGMIDKCYGFITKKKDKKNQLQPSIYVTDTMQ